MIYISFMSKQLTYKQTRFIDELVSNGFVKVRAALVVYDTKSYKVASKIADTNCNNPNIQAEMRKKLADKNVSLETVAEELKCGLESNRCYISRDGVMVRSDIPDMSLRYKYLILLLQLVGINTEKHR